MKKTLLALLASAMLCGQSLAQGYYAPPPAATLPAFMAHNGSLMRVNWVGTMYEFSYDDARPSLWGVGVRPGSVLMRGYFDGQQFLGTAVVFTHHCGSVPYNVTGALQTNGWLVLSGPEPVIDRWCRLVGGKFETNSTLVFTPWAS